MFGVYRRSQNERQVYHIHWNKTLDIKSFVKDEFPDFSEKQVKSAIEVLGELNQQILVQYNFQQWMVLKSHEEIEDFMKHVRRQYKINHCETIVDFLQNGVKQLVEQPQVEIWDQFIQFFQAYDQEHNKVKTIIMQKKAGGRKTDNCCTNTFLGWSKKKFIINYDGVMYGKAGKLYSIKNKKVVQDANEDQIKQFILFDQKFKMVYGLNETGQKYGIRLQGSKRTLQIRGRQIQDYIKFIYFVKFAKKNSSISLNNRYTSFAPERDGNKVKFYVDGASYFENLALAIQNAKSDIYMTGWWVSPEFPLIRPYTSNIQYRLDNLYKAASNRGVKVFIIVYLQSSMLSNDSQHTQKALETNQNIKVIRHPLTTLPTLWTHHQKMVVIDQQIAFMGGLDVCYGRYDDQNHNLLIRNPEMYPGIEYNNFRIADVCNVRQYQKESIPRTQQRLPWHDIAMSFRGPSVADLVRHFIDYWNHVNFEKNYQEGNMLTLNNRKTGQNFEKMQYKTEDQRMKGFGIDILGAAFNRHTSLSKEQRQKLQQQALQLDSQPMHSNQRMVVAQHDIASQEKIKLNEMIQEVKQLEQPPSAQRWHQNPLLDLLGGKPHYNKGVYQKAMNKIGVLASQKDKGLFMREQEALKKQQGDQFQEIQLLRSASNWSIGLAVNQKQHSIHEAYIDMIEQAQFFIYIENQYFISGVRGQATKNKIMEALFKKIKDKRLKKQKFMVYVVMPLIPGYPGELYKDEGEAARIIMHWQYVTISRHPNSLYSLLEKENINPRDYIQFYGLRTHAFLDNKPVTEIIYVHSKLMIVDDRIAICGSANINDRSMSGGRDSELAARITGGVSARIPIDGKQTVVSKSIHEMRMSIFMEHFGLTEKEALDPLNSSLINQIKKRTKKNTMVYRQVFGCYPDDNVHKISEMEAFIKRNPDIASYKILSADIKGHAVEQPLKFLDKQSLVVGKANLIPAQLFT